MSEAKTTLSFRGRTVEMNDENIEAALKQVGKKPVQMELPFGRVYGDIEIKEAMRGVRAIAKEAARLGLDKQEATKIMDVLIKANPIVVTAIDLMDEKLMGGD